MAVQKANILGAEQAERELLHQKAELEQRLKHEEDERNRLKEEQKLIKKHKVEPKQQSRTVPASDVSSSTNENESLDCKLFIVLVNGNYRIPSQTTIKQCLLPVFGSFWENPRWHTATVLGGGEPAPLWVPATWGEPGLALVNESKLLVSNG